MIIGPTPHKGEVFGGLGLAWHKRTFSDMPSSHGACISPPSPFEHSRCFYDDTSADGAADLLEVLRNSPMEKLNFAQCSQIPSAAWQKLRGASWTNLKEADFSACLVLHKLRCDVWPVRIDAFFFLECYGPWSRLFLWQRLATLTGQKCEIDSCKWSDLQKSLARGTATDYQPFVPTVLFWELQVLQQRHQCWWGSRPAGSLAQLSPGEVELFPVLSNSVRCVAEAAGCQLDQFERSRLFCVPRLAQTSLRCLASSDRRVFFSRMLWAMVTAVSLATFGNIDRPKMWNRQLQMVGLTKVTCKRNGNRLPTFCPHSLLLSTPGAFTMTPVPMEPQTCWKSCGILPWRSWTLPSALKFRPLRGRSCAAPAGPI